MSNILIIEDEADISELIKAQLETIGLNADTLDNGADALNVIKDNPKYDLYIIDWMLPEVSGVDLCRVIREQGNTKKSPVLMVTALTQSENIIAGLDAGADDYVTKPFDMEVLLARVRAQLRRVKSPIGGGEEITAKGLRINLKKCNVSYNNTLINLTNTEYQILATLAQEPGCVFTREQLINKILGDNVHVTNRTIDTHVAGLRKKLLGGSALIETIRGIGYRFYDING